MLIGCTTSSGICHTPVTRAASFAICLVRKKQAERHRLSYTCARAALDATCSGRSGLSEAPSEEAQEAGPELEMAHAIVRGKNGRRYEVDFGDAPVRVEVHASEETVEIFVEADFETHPEERRRFAIINIPRHLFSEATGRTARRAAKDR